MSWGAHGAMGEFILASLAFAKLHTTAVFLVALGQSGLGVPCSLLLLILFGSCPWSGFAAPWILVTWLLQSHMLGVKLWLVTAQMSQELLRRFSPFRQLFLVLHSGPFPASVVSDAGGALARVSAEES